MFESVHVFFNDHGKNTSIDDNRNDTLFRKNNSSNDDNNQIIAFVRTLLMTHLCGENGSLQWAPLIG